MSRTMLIGSPPGMALREGIDWPAGVFAGRGPGFHDDLVPLDPTPVECGRSLETVRRSRLGECGS